MNPKFYKKDGKKIIPILDHVINEKATQILNDLFERRDILKIPKIYIENWGNVALYDPNGQIENANSLVLDPNDGAYFLKNQLNELTGKEWTKFSCSWFVFNALREDLDQEKKLDPTIENHPATFSPTMIGKFIYYFTKTGEKVLDPFVGIGSTLEACKRSGRVGYGIELNKKYYDLCIKRTPDFKGNVFNDDAMNVLDLKLPVIDFVISSPPYWNILTRSTFNFNNSREIKKLDIKYSDSDKDIGNIANYDDFLIRLVEIYEKIFILLKNKGYMVVIVKNVKKQGKLYPLAWDLAKALSNKYSLKDEKIWIQDKIQLAPYGYPYAWVSNILHHYCLIFRKES